LLQARVNSQQRPRPKLIAQPTQWYGRIWKARSITSLETAITGKQKRVPTCASATPRRLVFARRKMKSIRNLLCSYDDGVKPNLKLAGPTEMSTGAALPHPKAIPVARLCTTGLRQPSTCLQQSATILSAEHASSQRIGNRLAAGLRYTDRQCTLAR